MKLVARRRSDQNRAVVDPWTAVHWAAGLALGLVGAPRSTALAMAVGWELVEQLLERQAAGRELLNTSGPESAVNATMDVAVLAAGHEMGRRWQRT